jgi:hypothetical protein
VINNNIGIVCNNMASIEPHPRPAIITFSLVSAVCLLKSNNNKTLKIVSITPANSVIVKIIIHFDSLNVRRYDTNISKGIALNIRAKVQKIPPRSQEYQRSLFKPNFQTA